MTPIAKVANPGIQQLADAIAPKNGPNGADFAKQLGDLLNDVNKTQQNAASAQTDLMTGRKDVDYGDLMISMEKASTALQLTMSVRNKLLDAYQTISQTQV